MQLLSAFVCHVRYFMLQEPEIVAVCVSDHVNLQFKILTQFKCVCFLVPGAGAPYGVFPSQAQLYAAAAAAQGPPPTYDQSLAHPAAATAAAVNQQVTFRTLC